MGLSKQEDDEVVAAVRSCAGARWVWRRCDKRCQNLPRRCEALGSDRGGQGRGSGFRAVGRLLFLLVCWLLRLGVAFGGWALVP